MSASAKSRDTQAVTSGHVSRTKTQDKMETEASDLSTGRVERYDTDTTFDTLDGIASRLEGMGQLPEGEEPPTDKESRLARSGITSSNTDETKPGDSGDKPGDIIGVTTVDDGNKAGDDDTTPKDDAARALETGNGDGEDEDADEVQ